MPHFKKLTPNLLVASVERSLAFYVDMLGFERGMTVPDASPFVFASVTSGPVEIFFNDAAAAVKEYPAFGGKPIGATGTLFIEVDGVGVDALHDRLKSDGEDRDAARDAVLRDARVRDRRSRRVRHYLRRAGVRVTLRLRTRLILCVLVSTSCVLVWASASSFCFSASSRWPASPSFPSAVSRW